MAINWRIPLPKKTEQVHRDKKSDYDRQAGQAVSLEESEWLVDCPRCGRFIQVQKADPTICPRCHETDIDTSRNGNSLEELNQGNHDEDRLEIFIASDQPEVCRYCGKMRTDFTEVNGRQLHTCPECGKSYWVEKTRRNHDCQRPER
jgi:Zn finger protein HypA/HybF involved in hydrogenase expression